MIRMRVDSLISLALFSILEIYAFVVPQRSANCSCVNPCSFRSSWIMVPSLNASNSASYCSLTLEPRVPYWFSKCWVKDVRLGLFFFIEVLISQTLSFLDFGLRCFLTFLLKAVQHDYEIAFIKEIE